MKNKAFFSKELSDYDNFFSRNYLKLLNQYLLFLFLLFTFYSAFIILFFGYTRSSMFLLGITFFWVILAALNTKINKFRTRNIKLTIAFVFIVLNFIASFFYVYTWKNGGVEYFYFYLLFSLPFFFNYKEDYYFILTIVIIIGFSFISCLFFEMDFLPRSKYLKDGDFKVMKLINITFSFIKFLIDLFFISQKDKLIYGLMKETEIKDSKIEDLEKTNDELVKQQIIINNLTEENISEILELAENDSPVFLDKFQIYFPDFIPNLLKISPGMISSEIHICALMRLNFDTKKIALCTNSSIRAIESRKYRVRKKLGIGSDVNINNFILKI